MSIPAGWYPDPQQQDQLRYWDGSAWTEHQTSAHSAGPAAQDHTGGYGGASAPQGPTGGEGAASAAQSSPASRTGASAGYGAAPAPGTADQTSPYGNFTESDSATQSFGAPGYSQPQQDGFGAASAGSGYGGGYGQPGPMPPPGKPNRTPLIVGGIVGVVLVVGLILLGVNLLSGDEDPPPTADPTTTATADPTSADPTDQQSGGSTDAGELAVGSTLSVDVPEGGTATATLTLDGPQGVRVYTSSSTDPVIRVLDAEGNELASDDDHEYNSSNGYDASVRVSLPQGQYTIEVSEWSGDPAQVTLAADLLGESTQIELGETEFQVEEDGVYVGRVSVQPGTYTVNVVSDSDSDPTLQVSPPGGEAVENDDRGSDAPDQDNIFDPYLEVTVTESGDLAVMIEEYDGDAFRGTLTIEQQ